MDDSQHKQVNDFLAGLNDETIKKIRNSLSVQRGIVERMEDGKVPLPPPAARTLLINTLVEQAQQCAIYETKATAPEVKQIVVEAGAWAVEALQRLRKLFDADSGTTTGAAN